jgi:RHS repeat-associated protein
MRDTRRSSQPAPVRVFGWTLALLLAACGSGGGDDAADAGSGSDAGPGPGGGCGEGPPPDDAAGYVHGRVLRAEDSAPLAGAAIRLVGVEGCVATDAEGHFALPVAGGGPFHLRASATDRVTGHRRGTVAARRDTHADDLFLVALDPAVTMVGAEGGVHESAAGGVVLDVPAGALTETVPVRATRFGAGKHLPGPLPETSHFTYAFEATVGGAELQAPVEVRLPNDLGFPPGTPVPVGAFDEEAGAWLPDGMGVVSEDGASIVYEATHFSSYDCNYPTTVGDTPGAQKKDGRRGRDPCGRNRSAGTSLVNLRTGGLRLDVEVPLGTAQNLPRTFGLVYRSLAAAPSAWIGGTAGDAPDDLSGEPAWVRAEVQVQGVRAVELREVHPESNFAGFLWDGVNGRGERLPTGPYDASMRLTWGLPGEYATAEVFGGPAVTPLGVMADEPVEAGETVADKIALFDGLSNPVAAGWFVRGVSQLYVDVDGAAMLAEDGASRGIYLPAGRLERRAGTGESSFGCPTGGPATEGCLGRPIDVATAPDGSLLIADAAEGRVVRITPDGDYAPVYDGGDGFEPIAVAVAPDGTVYVSDATSGVLSRVVDGALETIAGGDPPQFPGVPGPPMLSFPSDIAVAPDGRLIVADWPYGVRSVQPDGTVSNLSPDPLEHPDPPAPRHLALAADGSIWLSETARHRVRRWWPETGRLITVAGQDGRAGLRGDGGPATDALLYNPEAVAVGPDGTVAFADGYNGRVRTIDPDGVIRTLAGYGAPADAAFDEGGPASDALVPTPVGVHVDAAGVVFIADAETGRVLSVDPEARVYDRPASNGDRLTRTEDGWRVDRADGGVERFDAEGRLVERVDEDGQTTTLAWEGERLQTLTDPLGETVTLRWGAEGLEAVTDPHGSTTTFEVDAARDLVAVTLPGGGSTRFDYDDAHRVVGWADADDRTTTYGYGAEGRIAQVEDGAGHLRRYAPFETQGLLGGEGDRAGSSPDTLAPATPSPQSEWVDGAGQTWRIGYDASGEASEIVRPDGETVTIANHPAGMPALYTDAYGVQRRFFDAFGRLVAENTPEGERTLEWGDPAHPDRLTSWVRPDGEAVAAEYDDAGRIASLSVAGDDGPGWTLTYADDGQIESITDFAGRTRRHTYDERGNLTTIEGPAGVVLQLGYDARGNVTTEDGPGGPTQFAYDAMDRIVGVEDAAGGVHTIERDSQGLLTGVVTGEVATTIGRDGRGRLVSMSLAGAEPWALEYDGNDRITGLVNPAGGRVDTEYDVLDRVVGFTVSDGAHAETATIEWAGVDRMARAADDDSELRWTWDEVGQLASVTHDHPGMATAITLEYAVWGGRVRSVTYPDLPGLDGGAYELSYGDGGGLSQIYGPDGSTYDLPRDDFGRIEAFQLDWGDTLDVGYTYDAAGRVRSVVAWPDSWRETVAWQVANTYDVDDARLTEEGPEGSVSYGYDGMRRLASVTRSAGEDETFAWDALGNPTGEGFELDALQRVIRGGGFGYAYDGAGRVTERTAADGTRQRLAWDADDKLLAVERWPAGADAPDRTITYRYDALGRLVARTIDGATSYYIYDREDLVLELAEDGAVEALHIHGGPIDTPLVSVVGGDRFAYLRDSLGNVRALFRPGDTEPFATFTWSAFGELVAQTGDVEPRFGFHGAYRDADTGLLWMRMRWYDPAVGRFLSTDPLRFTTFSNPYAFPGLDPVNGRDPWGTGPPRGVKVAFWARQTYSTVKPFANPLTGAQKVAPAVAGKVAGWVGTKRDAKAFEELGKLATGTSIGPSVDDILKYGYDAWKAKGPCGRAKVAGKVFKDLLRGNKTFDKAVDDFINFGNLVPGR